MSLLTSVIAPPLLGKLLKDCPEPENADGIAPPDDEDSHLIGVEETGHG